MPIFLRPYRKVQPYGTIAILFYQQFIKLLCRFLGIINQYRRIADGLLIPHQKPPTFCKLNVENPPNKNIFSQIPNCNLRPYKIALIESLPLKNTATLFVYSEKSCKFATNKLTPLPIEQRAQGKPFII